MLPSSPALASGEIFMSSSLLAYLWRNGVCAPVGAVKQGVEVSRERDLLDVGAVGIGRVDALAAIDVHAENDARLVWRPMGFEREIPLGACLEFDRGEPGPIWIHNE